MKKEIIIIIVCVAVLFGAWQLFGRDKFGAPVVKEITLLSDFTANKCSISFDTANEVVQYSGEATSTLSVGDMVQFHNNDGDGTIVPMDVETYYYVTSASNEGFQINPTFASAAFDLTTAATGGEYFTEVPKVDVFEVSAGSKYVFSVWESLASAEVNFGCSVQGTEPTMLASKSSENRWDYCDVYDLQSATSIDGDTGLIISSNNGDVRQYQVFGDSLNFVSALVHGLETGTIGIKLEVSKE